MIRNSTLYWHYNDGKTNQTFHLSYPKEHFKRGTDELTSTSWPTIILVERIEIISTALFLMVAHMAYGQAKWAMILERSVSQTHKLKVAFFAFAEYNCNLLGKLRILSKLPDCKFFKSSSANICLANERLSSIPGQGSGLRAELSLVGSSLAKLLRCRLTGTET